MFLSDEQMRAARYGHGSREVIWSEVDLPTGRQPLPAWARDLHVDFADGYGNSPRYAVKAYGNLRRWDGKRFVREGERFMAVHPDGRAEVYYQAGALRPAMVKRWRAADGTLRQYPRHLPGGGFAIEQGEWVEVERLSTPQEQGFGGAHIDIVMADGTEVTLRGPWHGGAPEGYVELAYADCSEANFAKTSAWRAKSNRRLGLTDRHNWGTLTGGLFLAEDTFIRLFARHQPHLRLMRVTEYGHTSVQAIKADWDAPKSVILAQERDAKRMARFLATPEQERPPHSRCDFPQACAGKAACAVPDFNRCAKASA